MHQIRNFFMQSVQRSQTVVLEVVNLVHGELQRRLNVSLGSSDVANDDAPSKREQKDLLEQFAVVTSEAEMVKRMRENQLMGLKPFDVIITPFGCDHKSLPQHIRALLVQEEEGNDALPKRVHKRVSNFSTPISTPTPTGTSPTAAGGDLHGHRMRSSPVMFCAWAVCSCLRSSCGVPRVLTVRGRCAGWGSDEFNELGGKFRVGERRHGFKFQIEEGRRRSQSASKRPPHVPQGHSCDSKGNVGRA